MKKKYGSRKKKYIRKHLKKKTNLFYHSIKLSRIIKCIIILFLLFINVNFYFYQWYLYLLPNEILESSEYKDFNEIRNNITDNTLLNTLKEITIIKHLFVKNILLFKKFKNIIHITVSLNNDKNYKYILLVSMYSLLSNCDKRKSFIIYHILCTPDFKEENIEIFKSLMIKYYYEVEMIFYNMGNNFINRKNTFHSVATYYRIIAPILINSDRVIHLDGDTLTFSDLSKMYNLDFSDNYILGMYDYISKGIDYLGIRSNIYINAGVTLLNLKKIREDNKVIELIKMANSRISLRNEDQTLLNYVLYPKIGRLPSKYVIPNFNDKPGILFYLNKIRTKIPIEELEEAMKNPTIIHHVGCRPKVWYKNSAFHTLCRESHNCSCKKYFDIWHSFARQTNYYDKIAEFTGVKK